MAKYKGLSFPFIFNTTTGVSNVDSDLDKVKSNVRLLLSTRLNHTLFIPEMGVNLDAILFSDDNLITRDFIYSFVSDALLRDMPDVKLSTVTIEYPAPGILKTNLSFLYEIGSRDFSIDMTIGGGLNVE